MKFTTLAIENFLAIGSAKLALNDRGLMVIQGENLDNTSAESNGAGKSTLPDALCWALYGETARGLSGDPVVNTKAAKNCMVAVEVIDGMETYRVERYRKHKTHKNALRLIKLDTLANTETDLTKGTEKLTQAEVEKLIGCSYEVFRAAVYAGQEQMPNLPGMTDKQLKLLVEEAAGVTILESAYKEANARLSTAKGVQHNAELAVERHANWVGTWMANIAGFKTSHTDFDRKRQADVKALLAEAQGYVATVKGFEAQLAATDKVKLMADIAVIQSKIANLAAEKTTEEAFRKEVAALERQELLGIQAHRRAADDLAKTVVQLKKVKEIVGKPCGECGKPYCEHDIADREKTLSSNKAQYELTEKSFRQQLEDVSRKLTDARGQLSSYQSSMTDVSAQTTALSALNASVRDVEQIESSKKLWTDRARVKMEEAKRRKAAPNPFDAEIAKAEAELKAEEAKLEAAKKALKDAEEAVQRAEAVAKVFAPAGVRAHILDEVTPYLNDQTAKYLGTLTDGNTTATWTTLIKNTKGELREKFSIDVADATGGSSFAALSGGEKRKVRVAASLALQDLVATRATKPIELFVGDEIDDALDRAGLERLTSILDEKAKERGTVIVISHNDLRDWISNTVMVTKQAGQSTITENLS